MVFRLIRTVAVSPFLLLWKAYNGLWWAFSDDPAPAQPAQDTAFQVVDSLPQVQRPTKTLKWGFASTLGVSATSALVCAIAADDGALRESTAVWLWAWITGVWSVGSVWAVRHVSRRQAQMNAQGWRDHARATAAGFADMGRSVAGAAGATRDATVSAGHRAAQAYRASRDCARRIGGLRVKPHA